MGGVPPRSEIKISKRINDIWGWFLCCQIQLSTLGITYIRVGEINVLHSDERRSTIDCSVVFIVRQMAAPFAYSLL